MSNPIAGEIKRLFCALQYSAAGFKAAFRNEAAFRTELLAAAVLIPLGFWLGASGVEKALLVGAILLILIVELLNSAVETVVDRVSTERHELAGRAKDLGSAAVFVALVNASIVWTLVLLV